MIKTKTLEQKKLSNFEDSTLRVQFLSDQLVAALGRCGWKLLIKAPFDLYCFRISLPKP